MVILRLLDIQFLRVELCSVLVSVHARVCVWCVCAVQSLSAPRVISGADYTTMHKVN